MQAGRDGGREGGGGGGMERMKDVGATKIERVEFLSRYI